jgi:hypothetical protein
MLQHANVVQQEAFQHQWHSVNVPGWASACMLPNEFAFVERKYLLYGAPVCRKYTAM